MYFLDLISNNRNNKKANYFVSRLSGTPCIWTLFELAERAAEAPKAPEREWSEIVFCTNFVPTLLQNWHIFGNTRSFQRDTRWFQSSSFPGLRRFLPTLLQMWHIFGNTRWFQRSSFPGLGPFFAHSVAKLTHFWQHFLARCCLLLQTFYTRYDNFYA